MPQQDDAVHFGLVSFDQHGALRDDQDLLARLDERLRYDEPGITDVFVFSHGWLNDQAAATTTYQDWVRAMAEYHRTRRADIQRLRPGFRALLIGIHWPSAPWEDPVGVSSLEQQVTFYTDLIGDPSAADELTPLLDEARRAPDADTLSGVNEARLHRLDDMAGLRNDQVGAMPGNDRENFDAGRIFADFRRKGASLGRSIGGGPLRPLLSPLWVTSFWKMKKRAVHVGSTGVHRLLRALQAAGEGRGIRLHLIGHSFGCIVLSAALQGNTVRSGPLPKPVHSLVLLQGALSIWSFAPAIPDTHRSGYFHPVIAEKMVAGPVVTTQSAHDRALRWFFRAAATVSGDARLGPRSLPRYGAVGRYGLGGLADRTVETAAQPGQLLYEFSPASCYNVDSSSVIVGHGLSLQGAHSNLVRPELAGLVWGAVLSG